MIWARARHQQNLTRRLQKTTKAYQLWLYITTHCLPRWNEPPSTFTDNKNQTKRAQPKPECEKHSVWSVERMKQSMKAGRLSRHRSHNETWIHTTWSFRWRYSGCSEWTFVPTFLGSSTMNRRRWKERMNFIELISSMICLLLLSIERKSFMFAVKPNRSFSSTKLDGKNLFTAKKDTWDEFEKTPTVNISHQWSSVLSV